MDATLFDAVQGFAAKVNSVGQLSVLASVTGSVSTTVSGTVDVNLVSAGATIEVNAAEASGVNYDNKSVASSAGGTQIVPARSRKRLFVANNDGTKTLYVGFGTAPTTANGFPIPPNSSADFPANGEEVIGITTSGTLDARYAEFV